MSSAAYREAHRAELAAKQRAWRDAHPTYQAQYRAEHADQIAATTRAWRDAHPELVAAQAGRRKAARALVADARRAELEATADERRQRRLERIRLWRLAHPERVARYRRYNQSRKARLLGAFVERVDRFEVYDRGGGVCGICLQAVARDDFHVDHIVPLSRGGEHSYANTQPAHPGCNARKNNRLEAAA